MRLRVLLVVAAVALTAFAPVPFPKPKEKKGGAKGLEALQGLWRLVDRTGGAAVKVKFKVSPTQRVRVEGKTWTFGTDNGMGGFRGGLSCVMKLDPDRDPAWLDLTPDPAGMIAPKLAPGGGPYMVGLVAVDGDRMRFVYTVRGERPTSFTPKAPREYVYTFERVKP